MRRLIFIYGVALLFSIIITDIFFMNKAYQFLFSGWIWIPQIVENIINRSRYLDKELIFLVTLNHCIFPLYIRGYPNNALMTEYDQLWTWAFITFVSLQLIILIMQSTYGVYFFLPSFMRPNKICFTKIEHVSDELRNYEWCIWMSSIVNNEDQEEYDAMNEKVLYMETPWGHKYHPNCLGNINPFIIITIIQHVWY